MSPKSSPPDDRRQLRLPLVAFSGVDSPDQFQFFRHPRARRYVVSVRADGSVRVTIPRGGSRREALAFAERQRAWIERQRRRLENQREAIPRLPPGMLHEQRDRARVLLPRRLHELADFHGFTVSGVTVRNQQTRWGSCSPRGRICLNWRLVLVPDAVRDYVLLHELAHLKRMDHSRKFWKLVAQLCPDYERARRWLRENRIDAN